MGPHRHLFLFLILSLQVQMKVILRAVLKKFIFRAVSWKSKWDWDIFFQILCEFVENDPPIKNKSFKAISFLKEAIFIATSLSRITVPRDDFSRHFSRHIIQTSIVVILIIGRILKFQRTWFLVGQMGCCCCLVLCCSPLTLCCTII